MAWHSRLRKAAEIVHSHLGVRVAECRGCRCPARAENDCDVVLGLARQLGQPSGAGSGGRIWISCHGRVPGFLDCRLLASAPDVRPITVVLATAIGRTT